MTINSPKALKYFVDATPTTIAWVKVTPEAEYNPVYWMSHHEDLIIAHDQRHAEIRALLAVIRDLYDHHAPSTHFSISNDNQSAILLFQQLFQGSPEVFEKARQKMSALLTPATLRWLIQVRKQYKRITFHHQSAKKHAAMAHADYLSRHLS